MSDPVNAPPCSSEQAIGRVQYLRLSFGGHTIPEIEDRALVRLFLHYSPEEITRVIDHLVFTKPERRPGPDELSFKLKERRHGPDIAGRDELARRAAAWNPEQPDEYIEPTYEDGTDPDVVSKHINEFRQQCPVVATKRRVDV